MLINEKLNLVIPLYREEGSEHVYAYIHSTPLSREAFEANYLLLSKTFTAIHAEGLGEIAGPRVAGLMLRDIAKRMIGEGDIGGLVTPLLNEIRRLTMAIMGSDAGWEAVPYQEAINRKLLDAADFAEVENALVFFTVAYALYPRRQLRSLLNGAATMWGALITSYNSTEYRDSLTRLTPAENTGDAIIQQSSIAY